MISSVESAAYIGISAYPVHIEVDVSFGMPQFHVVGLPDVSIKESRERIRAAIKNSDFEFPPERITINLAPAHIKKEGVIFDLPMAVGILAASETLHPKQTSGYILLGELALDGSIRPIRGAVVIASGIDKNKKIILPKENCAEVAHYQTSELLPAENLAQVVKHLSGEEPIEPWHEDDCPKEDTFHERTPEGINFSEVRGQYFAKRAIEIAVAGGHNLLFVGSPGAGKTMLAKRIPSIMPALSLKDSLEVTKLYSVSNCSARELKPSRVPPFRAPHHSSSLVALTGGGSWPKPGEISLAHTGVLFLDEFPEFRRDALEALRGPLEDNEIHVSRAKTKTTFPARVMVVAAMNPCPCGYLSDKTKPCRCSMGQIQKYQSKVSGPIFDRMDLHVEVTPVPWKDLSNDSHEESSEEIRKRILACRNIQAKRYQHRPYHLNSLMRGRDVKKYAAPDSEGEKLIERAMKELHFSARAYFKILKVARTIADLANEPHISSRHITEAIQYRSLDRQWRR